MATINALPEVVNLKGYAGDTLFFYIWTKDEPNFNWLGQVREDDQLVAAFDIAEPEQAYHPTHNWRVAVSLSASKTRELVTSDKFRGSYDIQIQDGEIVKTLIRGSLIIEVDVTRAA